MVRKQQWRKRAVGSPAAEPGRIEVFDERAIRVGFIELAPGSKVIGFGARVDAGSIAYVARTDDVGLIWLERYRVLTVEGRR